MFTLQSTDAFSGLENDEALNSAQIDQRARALRDQLTLDKKISLMHGQQPFWLGRLQQPRVDRRRSDPLRHSRHRGASSPGPESPMDRFPRGLR
jgi:hypothetical protein